MISKYLYSATDIKRLLKRIEKKAFMENVLTGIDKDGNAIDYDQIDIVKLSDI